MTDREKVIKGLEYHLKELTVGKTCFECPYWGDNPCEINLIANAIALLKDSERIKVVRCKDCRFFEPSNAEEGDNSGYCRNDYAPCQNQTVDAWWFCGSAERVSE